MKKPISTKTGQMLALVASAAALMAVSAPSLAQQQCRQVSGFPDANGNCPAGFTKSAPPIFPAGAKPSCFKLVPCAPLGARPFSKLGQIQPPAHRPPALPGAMCKQQIDGEFNAFTSRIQRGMAAGVISAQEQAGLKQHYDSLKAEETKMAKDGLSPQECAQLNAGLTSLNTELAEALCSRDASASVHAAMTQAVQTASNARHGNLKVAVDPKNSLCVMEIQHEATVFHNSVVEGKKAGLIDAKEAAQLDAAEKRVQGLEQKALADNKVSRDELKHIVHAMRAENAELIKALATKAPAAAPQAAAHPPLNLAQKKKAPTSAFSPKEIHLDCKSMIDRDVNAFTKRVTAGMAAGVISAQERGDLEKEYNAIKAKEKKAMGDGKIDPKECAALYDDLADLNFHVASAMCSREPPSAVRAQLQNAMKAEAAKRHPNAAALVTANPNPLCMAEIQNEILVLQESIVRGKQAGLLDPRELADAEKGLAKVVNLEKKALSDKTVTPDELKGILAAIGEENKKLDTALASPVAAAKAKK